MDFSNFSLIILQVVTLEFVVNLVIVGYGDEFLECSLVALEESLSKLHRSFLQRFYGPSTHRTTNVQALQQYLVLARFMVQTLSFAENEFVVLRLTRSKRILDEGVFFRNGEVLGSDNLLAARCFNLHLLHLFLLTFSQAVGLVVRFR